MRGLHRVPRSRVAGPGAPVTPARPQRSQRRHRLQSQSVDVVVPVVMEAEEALPGAESAVTTDPVADSQPQLIISTQATHPEPAPAQPATTTSVTALTDAAAPSSSGAQAEAGQGVPSSDTSAQASSAPHTSEHVPQRAVVPTLRYQFRDTAVPKARPLLPDFSPQIVADMLGVQPPVTPPFLQALRALGSAAGGPVMYKLPRPDGAPDPTTLPLMLYLPGIDGTGLAAYRQFPHLSQLFDMRAVFLPPEDTSGFEQLVDSVKAQLESELTGGDPLRPVYLMGESFGGLVALALAQRTDTVDRIVLCNPATSFDDSVWPLAGPLLTALPEQVYNALPIVLSPVLTNPFSVALNALPKRGKGAPPPTPIDLISSTAWGLVDLVPELGSLRSVLPPATLAHRLSLLRQGSQFVNATLSQVPQRVMLLMGENDLVIPSKEEGSRLKSALPRCTLKVLEGRSHAMLQEAGLDLAAVLQQEDFYMPRRVLSSPPQKGPLPKSGAMFGRALPVELPTHGEVERALEDGGLALLQRLVSPVFFSTDPETGRLVQGLDRVPLGRRGRPVLLVGNHQTFAPDTPLTVAAFLQQRGVLIRGLTHPFALEASMDSNDQASNSTSSSLSSQDSDSDSDNPLSAILRPPWERRRRRDRQRTNTFGSFLKSFGGVQVSGTNFYKLLAMGETVLIYPGGVREAYKLKNEKYQLIWPDKPEFVRMAARFGATIVPFGAIGVEDGINQVLDSQELQSLPIVGDWLRQQAAKVPQARRGVSVSERNIDNFTPPLITLNPPARYYFAFGRPIETCPELADDREECDRVYRQVYESCEHSIQYLLDNRGRDPYAELGPRLLYEAAWGGKKQAPTFTP